MENKSIHCTLTDAELTAKADKWIYDLCHGASWIMHVPARPNEDPDLILSELNNRFKERLKAQPGPRWVKASDRLPEKDGYYCFRANGGYMGAYLRTGKNGNRWFCDSGGYTIRNWKHCEWLDESGAAAAGREDDAVVFAQWLATERWQPRINTEWARYETIYSDVSVKTTTELYELFKQQHNP